MIRKWIVRNFVLGTWVKIGKVKFHTLRAPRVIVPIFVVTGLTIITDPNYPAIQWFDIVLLTILLTSLWIGFNFSKLSYFSLWPANIDEMDDEQKHDYLRAIKGGFLPNYEYEEKRYAPLSAIQEGELTMLTEELERKYSKTFGGLKSLIPLALSILLIVVWYLFIAPHFIY